MPDKRSEELKPCPFCGGLACTESSSNSTGVRCKSCGSTGEWFSISEHENAIKAWNTRPSPKRLDEDFIEKVIGNINYRHKVSPNNFDVYLRDAIKSLVDRLHAPDYRKALEELVQEMDRSYEENDTDKAWEIVYDALTKARSVLAGESGERKNAR